MKTLCIILIIFFPSILFAQNKHKLFIYDNTFKEKTSKEKTISLKDSLECLNFLNSFIQNKINKGFFEITLDSIIFNVQKNTAYISTGEKYKWGKLFFFNIDNYDIKKIGIRKRYYSNSNFEYSRYLKLQKKVIKFYENNGYPFTEVKIDSLKFENKEFSGNFTVNKNSYITFDSLLNKGNSKTSSKFLISYLSIKKNSPYNEKLVSNIDSKLKKLNFINLKQISKIEFEQDKANTLIFIDDKKANQFNGILGILPNNTTEGKLLLTGELSMFLANTFNYGEKLAFEWKKIAIKSQDIKAKGEIKYIFGLPIGLDEKFNLQKIDTSYILLNNKSGFQFLLNNAAYLKLFFENKSSSIISSNNYISNNLPDLNNYNTKLGGSGFYIEKFDYFFNPTKGYLMDCNLSIGKNKTTYNDIENSNIKIEGNFEIIFYKKITDNTTFKFRNISGFMNSMISSKFSNVFYDNELYKIGGLNTIRGFDQESILASDFSIFNLEYRLLFEQNSAIYCFFDIAYYEKNNPSTYINDKPYGFGFGLDFETKAGIFTINYALGKQFDNPIEFRSAKIHFGLINRF